MARKTDWDRVAYFANEFNHECYFLKLYNSLHPNFLKKEKLN